MLACCSLACLPLAITMIRDGIDPSIPFYQNLGVEYNVTQNHTHIGANFNKYNSEGANPAPAGQRYSL